MLVSYGIFGFNYSLKKEKNRFINAQMISIPIGRVCVLKLLESENSILLVY